MVPVCIGVSEIPKLDCEERNIKYSRILGTKYPTANQEKFHADVEFIEDYDLINDSLIYEIINRKFINWSTWGISFQISLLSKGSSPRSRQSGRIAWTPAPDIRSNSVKELSPLGVNDLTWGLHCGWNNRHEFERLGRWQKAQWCRWRPMRSTHRREWGSGKKRLRP